MRTSPPLFWNAVPVLFLFSVFAAGSTYGYFIHRSELFPYGVLKEAKSAYRAIRSQSTRKEPSSFLAYVPAQVQRPTAARVAAQQPDDWILVTGGPYEFLEECPRFGCLAWIVDRNGKVIHHWETDLDQLWRDADHVVGRNDPASFKWVGTELLEDGSLLVAFHNDRAFPEGAGLAKFDRDGKIVWRSEQRYINHWFTLGPDARSMRLGTPSSTRRRESATRSTSSRASRSRHRPITLPSSMPMAHCASASMCWTCSSPTAMPDWCG